MSVAVHSPSGWPFGISSKERKKNTSLSNMITRCLAVHPNHPETSFRLSTLTYFIDIQSPLSHIIAVSDDRLLVLRHHVVLTDYDRGPHDTPLVCPLPRLDL